MTAQLAPVALASLALALATAASPSQAADHWPAWRGARQDGISPETNLPTEFSATRNVAWRLPLPGPAGATPVVWGDRIFLTSVEGQDLVLICASTEGKQLWKRVVSTGNQVARGDEGNYASPSPSTDGQHVWCFFGSGDLACYDFEGNEVWKFNVQDRYGRFSISFGMSSTPVLDNGRLYLQLIHGEMRARTPSSGTVVALDAGTGNEIWRHTRESDARAECKHSYASPIIYRDGDHEFLLTHGADYVVAHSLEDGRELWRAGGLNPRGRYNNTLRLVATPVAAPGLIVVPSAKNGPVLGLKPDGAGDITGNQQHYHWERSQNTPDVPSPLVHDGLVYLVRENGNMLCLDAATGEEHYGEQRTHAHRHRASPLLVDGKIYLAARDGTVTVVQAGREFRKLATNEMGEDISSSPIAAGGTLYLRTFDALYAIRAE